MVYKASVPKRDITAIIHIKRSQNGRMFAKMTKKSCKDLCPVIPIAWTHLIKFPRQVFCAPECSAQLCIRFLSIPFARRHSFKHRLFRHKSSFASSKTGCILNASRKDVLHKLWLSQNQRICHRSAYIPSYTFTQRSKNSVSCTRPRASSAAATIPIHSFTYSRVQPCFSQYLAMYFSASSFSSLSSRRK